jgi:hypothetical protein
MLGFGSFNIHKCSLNICGFLETFPPPRRFPSNHHKDPRIGSRFTGFVIHIHGCYFELEMFFFIQENIFSSFDGVGIKLPCWLMLNMCIC